MPLYVRYLGIEAYGVVGLLGLLQGLASVLDLGLTTTVGREVARMSVVGAEAGRIRSTVRTLEFACTG